MGVVPLARQNDSEILVAKVPHHPSRRLLLFPGASLNPVKLLKDNGEISWNVSRVKMIEMRQGCDLFGLEWLERWQFQALEGLSGLSPEFPTVTLVDGGAKAAVPTCRAGGWFWTCSRRQEFPSEGLRTETTWNNMKQHETTWNNPKQHTVNWCKLYHNVSYSYPMRRRAQSL